MVVQTQRDYRAPLLMSPPPVRDARVRADWVSLGRVLAQTGLVPPMAAAELLANAKARHGSVLPEAAVAEVMCDYVARRGHAIEGARRCRARRFFLHREGDHVNASQLVRRLSFLAPELGTMLFVMDDPRQPLKLRTRTASAVVPRWEIQLSPTDEGKGLRRSVTVRGLLGATNRLLALHDLPFRFVPLATADDYEAYVGVNAFQAMLLDNIDALHQPLIDLRGLLSWRPLAPAARHVAQVLLNTLSMKNETMGLDEATPATSPPETTDGSHVPSRGNATSAAQ